MDVVTGVIKKKYAMQYMDSRFMEHTQSEQLVESIKGALSPLHINKLLLISIDGPSVNLI